MNKKFEVWLVFYFYFLHDNMENDPHKQDTVAKLQNFGNLMAEQSRSFNFQQYFSFLMQ